MLCLLGYTLVTCVVSVVRHEPAGLPAGLRCGPKPHGGPVLLPGVHPAQHGGRADGPEQPAHGLLHFWWSGELFYKLGISIYLTFSPFGYLSANGVCVCACVSACVRVCVRARVWTE